MDYVHFFKDKKITVMGLGLLGRGVGDILFLAQQGVQEIIVTDLKNEEELRESVEKIQHLPNVTLVLGEHRISDFRDRDFILKAAGVPFDSKYIREAQKHNVPVYMSSALFCMFYPGKIIGITGTRGKTTTTHLIYQGLKRAGKKVFLGGNIQGVSTLAHLPDATEDEVAVLELDSWQLQGFGEIEKSPHIAVFTNLLVDHLNYYKREGVDDEVALNRYFSDKANIFRFQKEEDVLVIGEQVVKKIEDVFGLKRIRSAVMTTSKEDVPEGWNVQIPGEHNRANIACALEVLRVCNISEEVIQESVEKFRGVSGRLEFVREVSGIKIYNDTTATTPDATLAGLQALRESHTDARIILIGGGADKKLDMKSLAQRIPEYCSHVFLLSGTGTDVFVPQLLIENNEHQTVISKPFDSLSQAVHEAMNVAKEGDIILFSPGFASFGMFKNEYDRWV